MPNMGSTIDELEKDIEGDFPWKEIDNNANFKGFDLYLPKFRVESDIDMASLLQKRGIEDLFDRGKANLTGE